MRCPKCNSDKLSVAETRTDGMTIKRRRICQACDYRFSTFERIEKSFPILVKKDGRREAFKAEKIRQGLIRACQKRPVGLDEIDKTVSEIETQVSEIAENEINSSEVGEIVLEALKKLDQIAYIRFVSVYREFSDLEQFQESLNKLSQ